MADKIKKKVPLRKKNERDFQIDTINYTNKQAQRRQYITWLYVGVEVRNILMFLLSSFMTVYLTILIHISDKPKFIYYYAGFLGVVFIIVFLFSYKLGEWAFEEAVDGIDNKHEDRSYNLAIGGMNTIMISVFIVQLILFFLFA